MIARFYAWTGQGSGYACVAETELDTTTDARQLPGVISDGHGKFFRFEGWENAHGSQYWLRPDEHTHARYIETVCMTIDNLKK